MSESTISVVINGQPRQIATGWTIAQLLSELEMPGTGVAVEINAEIQPGSDFATTIIQSRDRIEIVSLVGGG